MKIRRHHWLTIVLLIGVPLLVIATDLRRTDLYRPDSWAGLSFAVGASILTVVGIITSILTSNENNRRVEFNEHLGRIVKKLEEKTSINPDKSLIKIYENSKEKMKALMDNMAPLKYSEGIIGILSFYMFLVSGLYAVMGHDFKFVAGSFFLGVALSVGYIVYCMEEFVKIALLHLCQRR